MKFVSNQLAEIFHRTANRSKPPAGGHDGLGRSFRKKKVAGNNEPSPAQALYLSMSDDAGTQRLCRYISIRRPDALSIEQVPPDKFHTSGDLS
jgi:hypothetical protein